MPHTDSDPDRSAIAVPRFRQPGTGVRLLNYRPWPKHHPSLRGHADIDFGGWQIMRIPVFVRADDSLSVGVPTAPEVDGEGRQRVREDGKRAYSPMMSFRDASARMRWQQLVLDALRAAGIEP